MAQTLLGGVALRAGADGDPRAHVEAWLVEQGIDLDGLTEAAVTVADTEMEEVEAMIGRDEQFGEPQMRQVIVEVYEQAFLIGWICKDRAERREAAKA